MTVATLVFMSLVFECLTVKVHEGHKCIIIIFALYCSHLTYITVVRLYVARRVQLYNSFRRVYFILFDLFWIFSTRFPDRISGSISVWSFSFIEVNFVLR